MLIIITSLPIVGFGLLPRVAVWWQSVELPAGIGMEVTTRWWRGLLPGAPFRNCGRSVIHLISS